MKSLENLAILGRLLFSAPPIEQQLAIPLPVEEFALRAWAYPPIVSDTLTPLSTRTIGDVIECTKNAFTAITDFLPAIDCLVTLFDGLTQQIFDSLVGGTVFSWEQFIYQVTLQCYGEFIPVGQIPEVVTDILTAFKEYNTLAGISTACGAAFRRTEEEEVHQVDRVGSYDPNDKFGSGGAGGERFVAVEEPLRYSVLFENVEMATAPAQEVIITDQLDPNQVDLSTFALGPIFFGETSVIPPPASKEFTTDVDLISEIGLLVRIEASLNEDSGLVLWRFTAIDPNTGTFPDDPLAGFLPPNVTPPEGDGSVLFTVMPKPGLPTGTEIRNMASIVFDVNPAIETPEWLNTIDASNPVSQVCPLNAVQPITDFTVTWSGTDEGAGIQDYTIYVSEDGGPFSLWLQDTPDPSAVYSGQPDTFYSFYSEARDLTGNREVKVATVEATTQVLGNCMTGNVNGITGFPCDVLLVNGSPGDANRIVTAATGESLQFDFHASPVGPASGRYLLWVWRASSVNPVVLSAQGSVIGCLANPSPLNAGTPKPFQCVRGAQIPPIVCNNVSEFMGPAMVPWTLTKGSGFAVPSTFILQGIVQDNGALNPFGYSISNAVVLQIQ